MIKQNKKRPLISIITPTLNSERFISDNIKSILSQRYPHIEHIIIDGGSTDSTLTLVKELDPKAVAISEPDDGISDAFNKGIALAKGDIIATLNSDDFYADDDVIQKVVETFTLRPEIKVVYGKVRCIDPDTEKTLMIYYNEPFSFEKMKKRLIIPHPSVFMKREVYEAVGMFSLEYRICMDHDYLLRVTAKFEPHALDEIFTVMRWGGLSTKNVFLAHREAYRISMDNGVNKVSAVLLLAGGYIVTFLSLLLQRTGLISPLLFIRKQLGRL